MIFTSFLAVSVSFPTPGASVRTLNVFVGFPKPFGSRGRNHQTYLLDLQEGVQTSQMHQKTTHMRHAQSGRNERETAENDSRNVRTRQTEAQTKNSTDTPENKQSTPAD